MPAEADLLEQLAQSAVDLQRALDEFTSWIATVRAARSEGVPMSELYRSHQLRHVRDTVYERLTTFERSFSSTRAWFVRTMVDDEGMSLTEVAAMLQRSRQFVTRLYKQHGQPDSPAETPPP